MKTSNKILIIAAALAAAVLIAGIVGMRLYLDKVIEEGGGEFSQESITGSDNRVERKYDVKDFSNIQISGAWYAEISRGDEYSVEIAGPEMYMDSIGALDAALAIRGGELNGKLSGAGVLTYYGEVSEQKIKTEGAVEIKRGNLSF